MKKLNKKGFTIVELVIVIAVIAILAAVLIPTFSGVVDKANKSAAMQACKNTYTNVLAEAMSDGKIEAEVYLVKSEDVTRVYTCDSKYYTLGTAKTTVNAAVGDYQLKDGALTKLTTAVTTAASGCTYYAADQVTEKATTDSWIFTFTKGDNTPAVTVDPYDEYTFTIDDDGVTVKDATN